MYFIGLLFLSPLWWVFIAAWIFSSCGKQGLLSSCNVQASHCGGISCGRVQALGHVGFSSYGTQAQLPRSTWELLGQGIEPVFLALAGGLLTTGPPGKSKKLFLIHLHPNLSFIIFHCSYGSYHCKLILVSVCIDHKNILRVCS